MTIGALALAAVSLVAAQDSAPASATTTIVIVRHAEALADAGRDPALAEAGRARAVALAEALRDADVAAVYATQYQRTRMTGADTASAAKVEVTVAPIEGSADEYAAALASRVLSSHAGRTVVIVGHSNTVPALVKAFSGVVMPDLAHDSYDTMFVISARGKGEGRVVRARYGR
jgi:phosphohistidine phosphatase SixA